MFILSVVFLVLGLSAFIVFIMTCLGYNYDLNARAWYKMSDQEKERLKLRNKERREFCEIFSKIAKNKKRRI
jgi:hypothetical protein